MDLSIVGRPVQISLSLSMIGYCVYKIDWMLLLRT